MLFKSQNEANKIGKKKKYGIIVPIRFNKSQMEELEKLQERIPYNRSKCIHESIRILNSIFDIKEKRIDNSLVIILKKILERGGLK